LITLHRKESLDKKAAIVRALSDKDMPKKVITALAAQFRTVIGLVRKLRLGKNTRYVRRTSEFYSLFKAVMDLHNKKILFTGARGFARASRELEIFSAQVAGIADAYAKKQFGYINKHHNTPHYHYWMTTQSGTDKQVHRETRAAKLREIIGRAFPSEKDKKRYYSDNQKEQVWAASKNKKCSFPSCGKTLSWEAATIDHIIPWSQGGATDVPNAQLMCKKHNSMKGNKDFSQFFISS
jgi:5-methylcytosine-specific restriction endonuclease McrA